MEDKYKNIVLVAVGDSDLSDAGPPLKEERN